MLLLEAYADYAERMGPDAWARLQDGLAQAAGGLRDAEIAGIRGPAGLDAVVFYFPPGRSDGQGVSTRMGFAAPPWAWRGRRAAAACRAA